MKKLLMVLKMIAFEFVPGVLSNMTRINVMARQRVKKQE